jgi:amino acid transporter
MPRAGGSYLYASRGLNPYLGFIASFSQWFGLSIVIGVIAYVIVPFLRDIASAMNYTTIAAGLEIAWVRVSLALALIWVFVSVNIRGLKSYTRALVPMMFVMFALGGIVIIAGLFFDQTDFSTALLEQEARVIGPEPDVEWQWMTFLSAAALLFSSFIGFDAIAQAGGEARNPSRSLPLAILLAITTVGVFYFLFASAVYHVVPWWFVAEEAQVRDISAPGLLALVLPASVGVAILTGAAIALINDLPAMLLSVSRLIFAWAEDGIFPKSLANVHARYHSPYLALIASGVIASIGVLGSHFAGDFFLGIDIMVTAMMFNFLLMCLTLLNLPRANPGLAARITALRNRRLQLLVGGAGTIVLTGFLIIHVYKDLSSDVSAWYFHSTWVWLIVMGLGSSVFFLRSAALKQAGVDIADRFDQLPEE